MARGFARNSMVVTVVAAFVAGGAGMAWAQPAPNARPLDCVPVVSTFQLIPPLPGLFTPLPSIKGASEFNDLAPAPAGANLPSQVELRDDTQGFNSAVEVVLRDGHLYARPRHSDAEWRKVSTPGCLDGAIVATSINNNMLVALDKNGFIYSLDNMLSGPMLWNWTRLYGSPIWLWPGMQVPGVAADRPVSNKWSISHRISTSFTDADGNTHPTTAGLVELVSLADDGSRIIYQDPWLPADYSYEIGGPENGRFISDSISTSGSMTFVENKYGDMYTRKYDLDTAGANHIPGRYTWQPQPKKPSAPNQLAERFDPQYAAISLPAEDWAKQPKIPGEVTSRISVNDSGPTAEDRELRVEGRQNGQSGYWHKDVSAPAWQFTVTGLPLANPVLGGDPSIDQSRSTLAPESQITYQGGLPGGWTMKTEHFEWAQTKHPVTLTSPTGRDYRVQMYTTDALRFLPRGEGLDDNPRELEGALDFRGAQPWLPQNAELDGFVRNHLGGAQVYEMTVQATTGALVLNPLGSVLGRA